MPDNFKTILITGAGRGLGKALALKFLANGWCVIATDLAMPSPDEFLDTGRVPEPTTLMPGAGRKEFLFCVNMDVTSDDSVSGAFKFICSRFSNIDLIINNAGIDAYFLLSEAPVSEFRRIFEVNVFGAYRVNQVFLPILRRHGGRIIHIGSESLNLTMPFMTYPLSKKLVEGYAKGLRQELRFHGIDVVVIRPGAIDTSLLRTVSNLTPKAGSGGVADPLTTAFISFASQASKEIKKVISPEKAAAFIFSISSRPRPKAVYRINNMLMLRIAYMLPFGMIERIVHKRLSRKS